MFTWLLLLLPQHRVELCLLHFPEILLHFFFFYFFHLIHYKPYINSSSLAWGYC